MESFRHLDEAALARLDDGALIDHVLVARRAGQGEAAEMALKMFAFGMEDRLRAFVRVRLLDEGDAAVDEVVERTLESALGSIASLAGSTGAEARAFVFRIARRRIADFYRKARPPIDSIDADEASGDGVAPALREADGSGAVESSLLVADLLGRLRPAHRAVVELNVLQGFSARETVERMRSREAGPDDDSVSEQNVHQIASRFRRDLRAELDAGARMSR